MDFGTRSQAQASAIDDSSFPVDTNRYNDPEAGEGISEAPEWYNGPRSGHWTVASTVNGSAIDDRAGTVYGGRSVLGSVANSLVERTPGETQRIGADLMRRLALTTEKERKLQATEAVKNEETAKAEVQQSLPEREKEKEKEKEKGFYVPRLSDNRGIRIRAKDGKSQVIREPTRPVKPVESPKQQAESKPAEKTAAPPPAPASVRSDPVSNASRRSANLIRIVGKNGQEGFVELPFLPAGASPISRTQTQMKEPQPTMVGDGLTEKARRDAVALAGARQLQQERMANEAMMHGALPASSWPPSVQSSAKPSNASRNRGFEGIFDIASKPQSVASSKTSVTEEPVVQLEAPKSKTQKPAKQQKPSPPSPGWQEIGTGEYQAAPDKPNKKQPRGKAKQQKKAASPEPAPKTTPTVQTLPDRDSKSPESIMQWKEASQRSSHRGTPTQRVMPDIAASSHHSFARWPGVAHNVPTFVTPTKQPIPDIAASSHRSFAPWPATKQSPYRNSPVAQKPSTPQSQLWQQPSPQGWGIQNVRSQVSASTVDSFPVELAPPGHGFAQQSGSTLQSDPRGPTVFAGRGWISPHPLSEVGSYHRAGPEPHIQLPTAAVADSRSGVETMTYEEWLAVQNQPGSASHASASKIHTINSSKQEHVEQIRQDEWSAGRRNISRTSSHVSAYIGGSWGQRGGVEPAQGNYRSPSVKTASVAGDRPPEPFVQSVGGGPAPSQVNFHDENGREKTWLKMPWDGNGSQQRSVSSPNSKGGSATSNSKAQDVGEEDAWW